MPKLKPKLIVHVGLHKTGSTSIQVFLTKHRSKMIELGFLYPEAGCPKHARFGQHMLAWTFYQKSNYVPNIDFSVPDREVLKRKIYEDMDLFGVRNVVVSSEEFDSFSCGEISEFCSFFSEFEIHVIYFLRSKPEFLESAYKTSISYSSYTKDFGYFLATQRARLDFFSFTNDWIKNIGQGAVSVVNYDECVQNSNLLETFLSAAGIRGLDSSADSNVLYNSSFSAVSCEILKKIVLDSQLDVDLVKSLLKERLESRLESNEKGRFISNDQYYKLLDSYRDDIKMIKSTDAFLHGFDARSFCENGVFLSRRMIDGLSDVLYQLIEKL